MALPNYAPKPFLPQPKDPPRRLVKQAADAKVSTTDKKERAICHTRSGGRCEVRELEATPVAQVMVARRCARRASENHHLLGGIGRRNKGRSILAAHRIDTCARCHKDITGKVLVPIDGIKKEDAATVTYERKKLRKDKL